MTPEEFFPKNWIGPETKFLEIQNYGFCRDALVDACERKPVVFDFLRKVADGKLHLENVKKFGIGEFLTKNKPVKVCINACDIRDPWGNIPTRVSSEGIHKIHILWGYEAGPSEINRPGNDILEAACGALERWDGKSKDIYTGPQPFAPIRSRLSALWHLRNPTEIAHSYAVVEPSLHEALAQLNEPRRARIERLPSMTTERISSPKANQELDQQAESLLTNVDRKQQVDIYNAASHDLRNKRSPTRTMSHEIVDAFKRLNIIPNAEERQQRNDEIFQMSGAVDSKQFTTYGDKYQKHPFADGQVRFAADPRIRNASHPPGLSQNDKRPKSRG